MFNIQCLESSAKSALSCNAKFVIEPLEKGHGITIGNALRRTLLSHVPGIAIVGVRISNINHEFSTIYGVKEDVIEVLLNLKQLVFRGEINGDESIVARLNYKGNGIITASNIELPPELTFVDPQQHIASCIAYTNIEMEFLVSAGYGYYLSTNNLANNLDGFITLDATFLPVRKVNFFVETSKSVSSLKNESLILEIETDGSITPTDAINIAGKKLTNLFSSVNLTHSVANIEVEEQALQIEKPDIKNTQIDELELSVRAHNCLKRANIHTVGELLEYSEKELLEFKNFGKKSADEVSKSLSKRFNIQLS
jgi:DNA-directed RNA polymerase subunit alpha